MPKRTDISKILIIGAGPITIGQACEFDYSGTQACKSLVEEGYEVILVNSNPATIMTDPQVAQRTYIEPLTVETLKAIISKERPDALLPTMGGQTSLNLAVALQEAGVLRQYNIELIGANIDSIKLAEDRELFKKKMLDIGLPVPKSCTVSSLAEAMSVITEINLPVIIRPAFTLGGSGGGFANTEAEFRSLVKQGLAASPVNQILIEESVAGWKEIELEVMRDCRDNVIIVCGIENIDPMGVHTGDSITVAPIQTLSDKEYQDLRDAAIQVIRAVNIDSGGSNIQFAVNPKNGDIAIIEMNPRVSRSSALASKATGYPIARVAAKLAVGMTLDEIANGITTTTPACFEPALDYVVTKIPRFDFGKFPGAATTLTSQMKSVGEVMATGRTFKESFQKALRGLELGLDGFQAIQSRAIAISKRERREILPQRKESRQERKISTEDRETLINRLAHPSPYRICDVYEAFNQGFSPADVCTYTSIDLWFISNMYELWQQSQSIADITAMPEAAQKVALADLKRDGFSDPQITRLLNEQYNSGISDTDIFHLRKKLGLEPAYNMVDTCAGEFISNTPYFYSTYETQADLLSSKTNTKSVAVIGGGPNRIGQGIEFDYCCVHTSLALKEQGYNAIMINSNPETVSTDFNVSDRLYFEPVTLEDVSQVLEKEQVEGVIIQMGGQTPLKLAHGLVERGYKILGTPLESIDTAEDRAKLAILLAELGMKCPSGFAVASLAELRAAAGTLGYPVIVRPNYVLGGKAMCIVNNEQELIDWCLSAYAKNNNVSFWVDKFLENAIELDVDVVADGKDIVIAGILEQVEPTGVHSGDSSCVYPPQSLSTAEKELIIRMTARIASRLGVIGLLNIQYAIYKGEIYVIEINPRASRTVPFISKVSGIPWARIATRVIMGEKLADMNLPVYDEPKNIAVKSVLIPYEKFPGCDVLLGPEMRSTGEAMGLAPTLAQAFYKALCGTTNKTLNFDSVLFYSANPESNADSLSKLTSDIAEPEMHIVYVNLDAQEKTEKISFHPVLSQVEVISFEQACCNLAAGKYQGIVCLDELPANNKKESALLRCALTGKAYLFRTCNAYCLARKALHEAQDKSLHESKDVNTSNSILCLQELPYQSGKLRDFSTATILQKLSLKKQ